MPKKILDPITITHPIEASHYSSANNTPAKEVLCTSRERYKWNCPKGHAFTATVRQFLYRNSKCTICRNKELCVGFNDLKSCFPNLAEEWDFKKNETKPENHRKNEKTKVFWVGKCGHKWTMLISARTASRYSQNCPLCAGQKIEPGVNDLPTTDPEFIESWDFTLNKLKPSEVSRGSRKEVWWKCSKENHSFIMQIKARVGDKYDCPYCSNRRLLKGFNDIGASELIKDWDFERNSLDPKNIRISFRKKVWWKCHKCSAKWAASPKDRFKDNRCVQCGGRYSSFIEEKVFTTLREMIDEQDIIRRSRPLEYKGKKYELDFLIPSKSIAFEVQDFTTHSRNNDFEKCIYRKSQYDQFKKGPNYHALKRELAEEQIGVLLIDLWEDEVRNGGFEKKIHKALGRSNKKHSQILKDLDLRNQKLFEYFDSRNNLNLDLNLVKKDQRIYWKCSEGHSFKATKRQIKNSSVPCPHCGNRKPLTGFNGATSNTSLSKVLPRDETENGKI